MQIIDTDSINYSFVQICVIGGVFLFGTRQSLLQVNTQSSCYSRTIRCLMNNSASPIARAVFSNRSCCSSAGISRNKSPGWL